MTQTRVVTYECLHTAIFAKPWPHVGDELMCARCRAETRVFELAPEYAVSCGSCRFGRTFGVDGKIRAGQSAAKHANARGHVVRMYFGDTKIETVVPGPDTLPTVTAA
jgi:hypothetical protein